MIAAEVHRAVGQTRRRLRRTIRNAAARCNRAGRIDHDIRSQAADLRKDHRVSRDDENERNPAVPHVSSVVVLVSYFISGIGAHSQVAYHLRS
jgi:hypothetical protein